MLETVRIEKLVHGGQALGTLPDGRKVLVWNALPGESVKVRLTKSKRSYAEGIAEEIVEHSSERIQPRDDAYLSTSPWQIMPFESESRYKHEILAETLSRENVEIPDNIPFYAEKEPWGYRNKMEYSFWADDSGLHLALFNRGTHGKRIVSGSSIARPEIDETANKIRTVLDGSNIRGSQLKTVIVRCNHSGETVVALFVKDKKFPKLDGLEGLCKGIVVYFSDPKSPASVATKELYVYGDITLSDEVAGNTVTYDVNSFFQVNLPMFELALKHMEQGIKGESPIIDFYSGVGTIGLALQADALVESDVHNIRMARRNIAGRNIKIKKATAETALDYIPASGTLIVDPPRAGLHTKVIDEIRLARPDEIAYLSCNPITQARDIASLQDIYNLQTVAGYNFFPRTPHIESLAILQKV